MKSTTSLFLAAIASLGMSVVAAQSYAPPPAQKPDDETLRKIKAKTEELDQAIGALRRNGVGDALLADVEVFAKAANWIVKHEEWYHEDYPKWTLDALDQGLTRASQLQRGAAPWLTQPGKVVRGYRSPIDDSIQPYGLILPKNYGKDPDKKWRLDVVLHGRDTSLTEVKFIHQHTGTEAPDLDLIQLDIYGRGNNAYRWAGEWDVFFAITSFEYLCQHIRGAGTVDTNRRVLRGFSMGGAGAWHLGLHYPGYWCSVSPGAGFTTTHGYIKNLPERLPPYQEACLHIYDAIDYAENAANVPIVVYGGEKDPQLQAARNIADRLRPLNIPLTLIVGPNTEHKYHPDSLKEIMKLQSEHAAKGKSPHPAKVRFVTYTMRYPECSWVQIIGQERPYERSEVEAEDQAGDFSARTSNVRALSLVSATTNRPRHSLKVVIDNQTLDAPAQYDVLRQESSILLEKQNGAWVPIIMAKAKTDLQRRPMKNAVTPGPIDDAFTQAFLCVRGTGQAWYASTRRYADANLQRFRHEWSKYFRGELPIKDDVDVTLDDMTRKHLILFGDPASNLLIRQALDRLPLEWTKERISFAGQQYSAAEHVPVMVFPTPYSLTGYIVLNSGHTFHAADFEGTNALLYPRLGDYAILKLTPTEKDPLAVEVVTAGLFDENWQMPR